MGPSNNTWVTTMIPFPYEQWVNGTLASQSSYTQEIHFKVDTCMLRVEHAKTFCTDRQFKEQLDHKKNNISVFSQRIVGISIYRLIYIGIKNIVGIVNYGHEDSQCLQS